ncbi:MAG: hypothetical protein L6R42_010950 [Xanthoria sp. 1 TBL-2021]|nr:MAG: hypothetical protein L6R42_010950 [Xanthoria sp. 1 TBL-2021]
MGKKKTASLEAVQTESLIKDKGCEHTRPFNHSKCITMSDSSDPEVSDYETGPTSVEVSDESEGSEGSEGSVEAGTDVGGSNEAAAGSDPPEPGEGDVDGGDNEEDAGDKAGAIPGGDEGLEEETLYFRTGLDDDDDDDE